MNPVTVCPSDLDRALHGRLREQKFILAWRADYEVGCRGPVDQQIRRVHPHDLFAEEDFHRR